MNRLVRRSTLALALTALAPAGFAAPAAAPALGRIDPESLRVAHEKFVLPNGLTVLVHEDHAVPIVAVNLWYHVGSRDFGKWRTRGVYLCVCAPTSY